MSKVLFVFGTRPEAIKMAPLVIEFKNNPAIEVKVCVTGQHREMLDQVLDFFEIEPDYDLNIMKQKQSLGSITCSILTRLDEILASFMPAPAKHSSLCIMVEKGNGMEPDDVVSRHPA